MFDINNLSLFILSVFLLSVTPGPDMAYVVGQSIANGRRAGVISAAGVALGSCAHALASVVGLTALIAASPLMFTLVKYIGALYLIYLGGNLIWGTFGTARAEMGNDADVPEAAVHSRTVVGHEPPIKARQNQARESSLHTMWLETGS
ncbi:LysE family translocator [Stutzerimonas nitrititolerans]|uniref:LysE family translocator n=1 Tax=Stutzerimonas nitrititolerans TaxID=2482751 RepID=UPI002021EC53|nr:LysE family translocator [Stutzerimonas nitrititolerans]